MSLLTNSSFKFNVNAQLQDITLSGDMASSTAHVSNQLDTGSLVVANKGNLSLASNDLVIENKDSTGDVLLKAQTANARLNAGGLDTLTIQDTAGSGNNVGLHLLSGDNSAGKVLGTDYRVTSLYVGRDGLTTLNGFDSFYIRTDTGSTPALTLATASGNMTVKGSVGAASASVTNAVSAGSAAITGAVSAGSASITNAVSAGSASITGAVSAGSASITNGVSAASATITGAVSAGSASITNGVSAGSASITGAVSAGSASVTGALSAGTGSVNGVLSVGDKLTVSAGGADVNGILSCYGNVQVVNADLYVRGAKVLTAGFWEFGSFQYADTDSKVYSSDQYNATLSSATFVNDLGSISSSKGSAGLAVQGKEVEMQVAGDYEVRYQLLVSADNTQGSTTGIQSWFALYYRSDSGSGFGSVSRLDSSIAWSEFALNEFKMITVTDIVTVASGSVGRVGLRFSPSKGTYKVQFMKCFVERLQ